jgi:hypothetical protein
MRPTEGQIALGGLAVLVIWLFLVMPFIYCSTCEPLPHKALGDAGAGETRAGEWIIAAATVLLAYATYHLFLATKILAKRAEQDSKERKALVTTQELIKLRSSLLTRRAKFPDLREERDEATIKLKGDNARPSIIRLNAFAIAVNCDAYDFDTFYRNNAGPWFLLRYKMLEKYIDLKQPRYQEMKELAKKVRDRDRDRGVRRDAG